MRKSRLVTVASAIAIIALLFGGLVFFLPSANKSTTAPETTVETPAATLEPIVVVATR